MATSLYHYQFVEIVWWSTASTCFDAVDYQHHDGHGAGGQLHQLFAALANIEIRSDDAKCNKLLLFRAKNEGSVCHKKRAETESEAKIERMPVLNKDETRTFNCLQRRSTHAKTKSNLFSSCVAKI